jgi:hypothetical protein
MPINSQTDPQERRDCVLNIEESGVFVWKMAVNWRAVSTPAQAQPGA